jgi:hypothetical protein
MLKTEKQRRWWFANHPEFGRAPRGAFPQYDGPKLRLTGHPAADPDSYDKYEDTLDRKEAHDREVINEPGLIETHTALDVIPIGRSFRASELSLNWLLRRLGRGAVVYARKPKKDEGPGTWVPVARRPGPSLEHQSRMSGQPIREIGGKYYINEYEVRGVKFDDYREGVLYEYKGRLGHLFDKMNEFNPWVKDTAQFRDQAIRQMKAADGIPLIWRVGPRQVKPVDKAVGNVPGVLVVP